MKNFFKNIKPVWWFYLTATVLLFFNLGSAPLWASEDRWAEVARSMWLTGDWLHPAINGTVYFDKPLLTYWPIALLAVITGMMNEFIVRMPCVLAALAGLWGTRDLARRVSGGDEKTVNYSGWLLLGCYAYFFWARTAAAEMMNLTMILLAVDWFFHAPRKAGFCHLADLLADRFSRSMGKRSAGIDSASGNRGGAGIQRRFFQKTPYPAEYT